MTTTAHPFVKWVGGKGRLLPQLMPLLPDGVKNMRHVEPFLGGGALFFARHPRRALLSDVNADLISAYKMVRADAEGVIAQLTHLARGHDAERYYTVRKTYNDTRQTYNDTRQGMHASPWLAAMFIYLNKTCFNGLYRVNRKGGFNAPIGRYENPKIVDPDGLRAASAQLRKASIFCGSFESVLTRARPTDFVYFDPPYAPGLKTSFTSYSAQGFSQYDQIRLRDVFDVLTERGCKCMLSNSDTPFIRGLYAGHRIDTVRAARSVNCDASKRGKTAEVVVRNY